MKGFFLLAFCGFLVFNETGGGEKTGKLGRESCSNCLWCNSLMVYGLPAQPSELHH